MCITAMKEAMFGDAETNLDDTDDEWERSQVNQIMEPNATNGIAPNRTMKFPVKAL